MGRFNALIQSRIIATYHIQARLQGLEHWREDKAKSALWDKLSFKSQVRMTVFHGGRFVTFVGIWRYLDRPEFSEKEQAALNLKTSPVINRLITSQMLEENRRPDETLHLVTDEDGKVLHASPGARAWLEEADLESLRAIVARVHNGHSDSLSYLLGAMALRLTPMDTNRGSLSYLIHLSPCEPLRIMPDTVLTPAQREIAQLALSGATIDEIADVAVAPTRLRHTSVTSTSGSASQAVWSSRKF